MYSVKKLLLGPMKKRNKSGFLGMNTPLPNKKKNIISIQQQKYNIWFLAVLFRIYDFSHTGGLLSNDMYTGIHMMRHLSTDTLTQSTHSIIGELYPASVCLAIPLSNYLVISNTPGFSLFRARYGSTLVRTVFFCTLRSLNFKTGCFVSVKLAPNLL